MPTERMQHMWSEIPDDQARILKWLWDSENSLPESEWRTVSMEDYRFYAGHQDDDSVIAALQAQKRPTTTYNEIKPKVDLLIGLAAQAKHSTTVMPVGMEDEPFSELMGGVLEHYRRNTKLARKELECFEHTVKSGRSLLYFYIDNENPFQPTIKARRYPGVNFFLDPNSIEIDLSDSRYLFIEKWLPAEEIKQKWPKMDVYQLQSFGSRYSDMPQFFNEARDLYRIVEGWYFQYENVIWFWNPITNRAESLKPKEFNELSKSFYDGFQLPNGQMVQGVQLEGYKGVKKVPYYRIFSGTDVLEEGPSPLQWDSFPAILFGAYKDEDYNNWFGAITMMKDPQKAINTMRRQLSHLLQTLPKGLLKQEVGAVLNLDEYEQRSAEPNFYLEISEGKFDKVDFIHQPSISPIYQTFDAAISQSMKDVSGIQDPMLGIQTTSREPGISVQMRQEIGIAVLYILYSNFEESRHNATRLLLSLIQQYVTTPEVIRITGMNGEQLISINTQMNRDIEGFNDITAMRFDLAVKDITETATMRAATAQMLTEFSHNNPGVIPPDVILEYADVPHSVKSRVREYSQQSQEASAQQANLERMKVESDIEFKRAEIKLKEAELELKKQELELKRLDTVLRNKEKPESKPKPSTKGKKK